MRSSVELLAELMKHQNCTNVHVCKQQGGFYEELPVAVATKRGEVATYKPKPSRGYNGHTARGKKSD